MAHLRKKANGRLHKNAGGHLINQCIEPVVAFLLTQCNIECPNTDCDDSETKVTTEALSNLDHGDLDTVIKIDGSDNCWSVTEIADDTGAEAVTRNATYADCEACCDPCYPCGSCEYHPDSTLSVKLEYNGTHHTQTENCSDEPETQICFGFRFGPVVMAKVACNTWRNNNTPYAIWDSEGGRPPCGWEEQENLRLLIRKDCATGKWQMSRGVQNPFDWWDLDAACKVVGGLEQWYGDLGTGCSGGSASGTVCCHFDANPHSFGGDYDSYIIVENNEGCEAP